MGRTTKRRKRKTKSGGPPEVKGGTPLPVKERPVTGRKGRNLIKRSREKRGEPSDELPV